MRLDINIIVENYRKILIFVFVGLIAILLASITNNALSIVMEKDVKVKPSEDRAYSADSNLFRTARSVSYYDEIIDRNIFDSQNRQPDESGVVTEESEGEEEIYTGPPRKSDMNATLVGTMVFTNPAYSIAKISRGSRSEGETESYRTGDSLFGEATVSRIERNRVYIERGGRMEYLEIEGPRATVMPSYSESRSSVAYKPEPEPEQAANEFSSDDVREVSDGKFVVNRKMLDSLLSNYNSVLTQARAIPNFEGGKANGFKIFAIRKGSIYSAIGIQNGDVMQRVNGNEINNLEKVLSLFTQLRNENSISLDIIRGGQKKSLEYEIK